MDISKARAEPGMSDAHRGQTHMDTLNVRLFNIAYVQITPLSWQTTNVCSSYWRFYANDGEGATLLLHGANNEKHPFSLGAEESFLVPAGVRFDCRCTTPSIGHFYVHFEVSGMSGVLLRELFNRPLSLSHSSAANEKSSEIARALKDYGGGNSNDLALFCRTKAMIYDALAVSLGALLPSEHERYREYARLIGPVLPALELIERRFAESLTNRLLADACFFSEDYFVRRFKECVGEPPAQYLRRRRVETAANRLLFSTDSIERIATDCGFGNRFHFTRVFKNRLGTSPAIYRKAGGV